MKKLPLEEAKDVMKMRLHMAYLTCNYASSEEVTKCPLCGEKGVITTEHYFACTTTTALVKIWDTTPNDIISKDYKQLRKAKNFVNKVEMLMVMDFKKNNETND